MTRFAMAAMIAALAGGAQAQESGRAALFQAMLDCRQVADGPVRLACYDEAAGKLGQAEASGEVVVVDKAQVQQARRAAFGLNFQIPAIFERGAKPAEAESLTAVVASASQGGDGKWVIILEDGAVWRQTDAEQLARRPRKGSTVEIRKAAMGSYFMKLDGQRAIRAHRDN